MRIDYDRVSGALYIKMRDGEYDHTEDFSDRADVYLDVDADGNVLGLEALSFEDLAEAIEEREGSLEVPDRYAYQPADEMEITRGPYGSVGDMREEVSESVGDVAGEVSESVGDEEAGSPRGPGRRARR